KDDLSAIGRETREKALLGRPEQAIHGHDAEAADRAGTESWKVRRRRLAGDDRRSRGVDQDARRAIPDRPTDPRAPDDVSRRIELGDEGVKRRILDQVIPAKRAQDLGAEIDGAGRGGQSWFRLAGDVDVPGCVEPHGESSGVQDKLVDLLAVDVSAADLS